jgi:hypothetical protein
VLFVIAVLKAPFDAYDALKRIFSLINDARTVVATGAVALVAAAAPPPVILPSTSDSMRYQIMASMSAPTEITARFAAVPMDLGMTGQTVVKATGAFDMIATCGPSGITITCRPY